PLPESFALPSALILPSSTKEPGCPSVPCTPRRLLLVTTLSKFQVKPIVFPFSGQTTLVCQVPSKCSAAIRIPGKKRNAQTSRCRVAFIPFPPPGILAL